MEEIWKDIGEYNGVDYTGLYQVSNMGNVRGIDRYIKSRNQFDEYEVLVKGKEIKSFIASGYVHVKLTKDKICRYCLVQRLVALAFIPNPDNLSDVDHIDENKLNNCVDNLRWVTHSANVKRSFRRTKNWKNIEVFQYNNEGDLLQKFPSVTSAAKANGIGTGIISKCCTDYEYVKTVGGFVFSYSELSKEEIKKIINSKTA